MFHLFAHRLPPREASSAVRRAAKAPTFTDDEPDWIKEIIMETTSKQVAKAKTRGEKPLGVVFCAPPVVHDGADGGCDDIHGDDDDGVWDRLAARRVDWLGDDENDAGEDFGVVIRGGKWTKRHSGRDYGFFTALAGGGLPREWCEFFGFQISYSFSVMLYDELNASRLAVEVCKRLQHFYDIYIGQESLVYVYTPEDLSSYKMGAEYVDFLLSVIEAQPHVYERGTAVNSLLPTNGLFAAPA